VSPATPWLFDEAANAGAEHLDPEYIQGYDRKADFDPADDLTTLRDRGLGRKSSLIDLGCGTGEFAIAAAQIAGRVIAVDVSEPMLQAVRKKVRQHDLANIEVVHAGFLSYEHAGPQAGFVYSRHALHHLPDFWKAVAVQKIAATLVAGGVFLVRDLVYSFDPCDAPAKLEAWMDSASRQAESGWTREELELHIRAEHSTFSWLLEAMLVRAGFTIESVWRSPSEIFAAYVCLKA
jgi:SAM-dependent methyltransferase